MIQVKNLLLNIKNILFSEENKKEVIQKIIFEKIKIEIEKNNIEIKNNTVYLNIKPLYKNEIFIQKEDMLSSINQELKTNFFDFR